MNNLIIRSENSTDYNAINFVTDQAFKRPNEGILVSSLRRLPEFDPHLSLVAEIDHHIVGHVLFFPIKIQSEDNFFPSLNLGPIAVIPDFQQRGIGGKLIEAGHLAAKGLGYTSVILLGHPSYYPHFGYKLASTWDIRNPWNIHNDAFMALELVNGALEGVSGLAIYPQAFHGAT